jgi:hypothetical protein
MKILRWEESIEYELNELKYQDLAWINGLQDRDEMPTLVHAV